MNPTLRETDLLELLPAREAGVRPGDIILFRPYGWKENVVHRVTAVEEGSFRTRGDNSDTEDPWALTQGRVAGVVVAAWRGRRRRWVARGRLGILTHHAVRLRRHVRQRATVLLQPLWKALEEMDLSFLLPSSLEPRVVTCGTAGRQVRRLLLGKMVVGRFDEARGEWRIRKPWSLFLGGANIP